MERPTTLIIDDEVPRVPKRASFFERPIHGDLGPKTQRERTRFSFKHPLAKAIPAIAGKGAPSAQAVPTLLANLLDAVRELNLKLHRRVPPRTLFQAYAFDNGAT